MACKTDKKRALQALWLTPPPLLAAAFIIFICYESKHGKSGKENSSWAFIGFTAGEAISTLSCNADHKHSLQVCTAAGVDFQQTNKHTHRSE